MFQRRQQIGTQTAFFFTDSIQVPTLQQQCEEALSEIFRFFRVGALSPHKTINWSPIRAAKFFECRLCSWRWTLRCQYDAPMRGRKYRALICISADGGQRSHIIDRGHMAIQSKS